MLSRLSLLGTLPLLLLATIATAEKAATWEEGRELAARTDRLLVVDFYADWCGPCKRFDKALVESTDLQAALASVVLVQTDAEKEGKELAEQYRIGGYPTYLVLNARGETLGRWWGYDTPASWIAALDEVLADPTTMAEKAARFENDPTAKDARVLARYHHTRSEFAEAVEFYDHAAGLDPEGAMDDLRAQFDVLADGHRGGEVAFDTLRERADRMVSLGPDLPAPATASVAATMVRAARREDDPSLARKYLVAAIDRLSGAEDEDAVAWQDRLAIDHALIVEEDAAKAVALKKAQYDEGWQQDSNAMNGFAWWCFENRVNLEEAEKIGRAAVELASSDADKASVLDTVAEICNLRGDCRDAASLAEQALALDPDSEYLQKQVEKFQKLLAAASE